MEIPERYCPNHKTRENEPTHKLFLANVSDQATVEDLQQLFSKYGKIEKIKIWNGTYFKCAKIRFQNVVNVKTIQCELSGLPFKGQVLMVAASKTWKQIEREYKIDTQEQYSNEICVYGYRYYKQYCDTQRMERWIHTPHYVDEIKVANGPKQPDEKDWDYSYFYGVIKPHINQRMQAILPVMFRYRFYEPPSQHDLEHMYDYIPSQAGKWFPNYSDCSDFEENEDDEAEHKEEHN